MTLEEKLEEAKEIKDLLKTALKNNVSAGSLLGYTTNGTKIVYEGATATSKLLKDYNMDISQINSLIQNRRIC